MQGEELRCLTTRGKLFDLAISVLDDVSSWLFFDAWPIADIPAWDVLQVESRWDFGCQHSITWLIVSELQ